MYDFQKGVVIFGLAVGTLVPGTLAGLTPSRPMADAVPAARADTLPHILSNDNRRPAGELKDGVLRRSLPKA